MTETPRTSDDLPPWPDEASFTLTTHARQYQYQIQLCEAALTRLHVAVYALKVDANPWNDAMIRWAIEKAVIDGRIVTGTLLEELQTRRVLAASALAAIGPLPGDQS